MSEPTVTILTSRGGRPRAKEPGIRVSTWIPESEFDELTQLAVRRAQSLSSLVKELLRRGQRDVMGGFPPN